MQGTIITPGGVVTTSVTGNKLELQDQAVVGFTNTLINAPDNLIPLPSAINAALNALQNQINTVMAGDGGTVFTPTLVSKSFLSVQQNPLFGWNVIGPYTRNEDTIVLSTTDGTTPTNSLSVPTGRMSSPGRYFLHMTAIDISGGVEVLVNDIVIETITIPGDVSVALNISSPVSDVISLRCVNLTTARSTILTDVYLVGVRDTLTDYVNLLVAALAGGSGNLVTTDQLANVINTIQQDVSGLMLAHTQSENPHPQYVKHSDLGNIGSVNEIMSAPLSSIKIEDLKSPYIIARMNKVSHATSGPYDPSSGYITSSVECEHLSDAVNITLPILDRSAVFTDEYATITYKLIEARTINRVVFTLDKLGTSAMVSYIELKIGEHDSITIPITTRTDMTGQTAFTVPVTVPNLTADVVTATAISTVGDISGGYALGMTIEFNSVNPVSISEGVSVAAAALGGRDVLTLDSDKVVNVSGMRDNYPYVVSLRTDTNAVELHNLVPGYNDGRGDGLAHPLRTLSLPDPVLGDLSVTGMDSGNANRLYDCNLDAQITGSDVSIYHTFVDVFTINSINIKMNERLKDTASILLTLILYKNDGTTVLYGHNSAGTNPLFVSIDPVTGKLKLTMNMVEANVTAYRIIMNYGTINDVDVSFLVPTYNVDTKVWSDNVPRVLLGWLTKYNANDYAFSPSVVGNWTTIPVDGLVGMPMWSEVNILNPLFHRNMYVTSHPGFGRLTITPERITVVPSERDKPLTLVLRKW